MKFSRMRLRDTRKQRPQTLAPPVEPRISSVRKGQRELLPDLVQNHVVLDIAVSRPAPQIGVCADLTRVTADRIAHVIKILETGRELRFRVTNRSVRKSTSIDQRRMVDIPVVLKICEDRVVVAGFDELHERRKASQHPQRCPFHSDSATLVRDLVMIEACHYRLHHIALQKGICANQSIVENVDRLVRQSSETFNVACIKRIAEPDIALNRDRYVVL